MPSLERLARAAEKLGMKLESYLEEREFRAYNRIGMDIDDGIKTPDSIKSRISPELATHAEERGQKSKEFTDWLTDRLSPLFASQKDDALSGIKDVKVIGGESGSKLPQRWGGPNDEYYQESRDAFRDIKGRVQPKPEGP